MPHDERAAAIATLHQALSHAWVKAGAPSYNEIETRSEEILGRSRRLPSSTVYDILTGKPRGTPAKLDWLRRFWTVMRAIAIRNGKDPDSIGSLDVWKELHEAACAAPRRPRELAAISAAGLRPPPALITGYTSVPGNLPIQQASMAPATENCPDGDRIMSIRRAIGVEWWGDYSDVVPSSAGTYLSLEAAARLIHCYETAVVPGLLQTEAYAEAVMRLFDETLPGTAIGRMVELRMRRQKILTEPNPPRIWAVFEETALRRDLGDASAMTAQIKHLIEISELPNVTIQVIPAVTKIRTTLGYPITLLSFLVHELEDVVYLEQLTTATYLDDPQHVSRYSQLLTGLSAEALGRAETADFLRRLLQESDSTRE